MTACYRRYFVTVVILCVGALACGGGVVPAAAQPKAKPVPPPPLIAEPLEDDKAIAAALRAHYTKYVHRIKMRDGVHLHTNVYVPKDRTRDYPILLIRTPYSVKPYAVDEYPSTKDTRRLKRFAPSTHMLRDGYIFVQQDVRGRLMSEGTFMDVRPINAGGVDESTDAYDTVDWLVKNVPANNGKVGVWGISYPGFYAAQAAVNAHPAIKAVSPQAPVTDWFIGDDFHHNGAFFLADSFSFYSGFGKPRPKPTKKMTWDFEYESGDAYTFFLKLGPVSNADKQHFKGKLAFWKDLMAHGTLDAFWKARNPRPHYKNVKPAVMTVGGWYDAEDLFGALETYRAFETQSPGADNTLVMGPWKHGGWARGAGDRHGEITFGQSTSHFYQEHIELPFFRKHLKGVTFAMPEAWIFEVGTNLWHRFDHWPPKNTKFATYHFAPGGELSSSAPSDDGFDQYISDPAKPVPYRGEPSLKIAKTYMSEDQRFAARRPDVLVYQTDVLTQDVTMMGPIEASVWLSTTGTDADVIVKVIDVYPHDHPENPGYQQLVRGEVMRGKFRESFSQPKAFKPGEPTLVRFKLPDVAHCYRTGHRIMVQVQSSWFPLVDRNPQKFTDIYTAKANDFQSATHRVYRSAAMPSGVRVTLSN